MGKLPQPLAEPFTEDHLLDRNLIIQLLQCEDEFSKSAEAIEMMRSFGKHDLKPIYAMHRFALSMHGFNTSDQSVENYRKIFKTYFRSPDDYDRQVIDSVHYMRSNKCVFYKSPLINIGDQMIDVPLIQLDGTETTLFNVLKTKQFQHAFVGGFSTS
jgi:hypothetical protein